VRLTKITRRIGTITYPLDVCYDVHDLSALIIDECANVLLDDLNYGDFHVLDCYRDAVGNLVSLESKPTIYVE
jgi:hypothetical protein